MLVKQKENYHRELGGLQNYLEGQELSLDLHHGAHVARTSAQPQHGMFWMKPHSYPSCLLVPVMLRPSSQAAPERPIHPSPPCLAEAPSSLTPHTCHNYLSKLMEVCVSLTEPSSLAQLPTRASRKCSSLQTGSHVSTGLA